MNVRWQSSNLTTLGGAAVFGLWLALALIGAVFAGVTLAMGDRAPPGTEIAVPIGAAAMLLFGILAWLSFRRTRATVRVGWDGDALRLEIVGPNATVTHRGPFRIARGWNLEAIPTGRGSIRAKVVTLAVLDEKGHALLFLREQLGAIHAAPEGWPQRIVRVEACDHVYTNSLGRLGLDRLADALGGQDWEDAGAGRTARDASGRAAAPRM